MKTELEKFISKYPCWKERIQKEPYNIKIKEDENYMLLKYNQLAETTDWSSKLVQECRGIILRKSDLKIVCHGFNRFYNEGEPYASQIDYSTAKVQEKIDGSIIKVWVDDEQLHISTNGAIDAFQVQLSSMVFGACEQTFGDKFVETLFQYSITKNGLKNYLKTTNSCAMFELVCPENRIVVEYDEPLLYYLGSRNIETQEEFRDEYLYLQFDTPREYNVESNISAIKELVETMNGMEGVVVVDAAYNRIKVKNATYLIQHHSIDRIKDIELIEIVLKNEIDEYLATITLPNFKERLLRIKAAMDDIFEWVEITAFGARNILSKKEFAQTFKDNLYSTLLFKAYDDDNYKEKIKSIWIKRILELEYII